MTRLRPTAPVLPITSLSPLLSCKLGYRCSSSSRAPCVIMQLLRQPVTFSTGQADGRTDGCTDGCLQAFSGSQPNKHAGNTLSKQKKKYLQTQTHFFENVSLFSLLSNYPAATACLTFTHSLSLSLLHALSRSLCVSLSLSLAGSHLKGGKISLANRVP